MKTISHVLQDALKNNPDRYAVHLLTAGEGDRSITYGELVAGSVDYAHTLHDLGVRQGDIVILILTHGEDLLYSFFGAVLLGAVPSIMPFLTEKLSPDQYRRSLAALLEITAPAAAVTSTEFLKEIRLAEGSLAGPSPLRAVLTPDQVRHSQDVDFSHLPGLLCSPDDIVLLQHSSGTTGLQKGVALTHRAVFNQLQSYSRALHQTSDDVIVSWLPLYHDMGLIAGFLLPILTGIPLVLMSPFDWVRAPARLMRAVSTYRGTLTWLPNFAYNFCAQKIRDRDMDGVDLTSWRAVINCSEPMYWSSHQMFIERFQPYGLRPEALATCYAMAENVFAVTQGGIDSPVVVDRVEQGALLSGGAAIPTKSDDGIRMLSAGHPLDNVRVRVLDGEGRDLPERRIGEIALKSNCMLEGYYHRPDLTQKAFLDGWYLTGDLGYLADGEVYITGRKKDLIIVGGKNVYPQDIERLVSETPGVHPGRVAAFGVYNERSGTEDVVVVAESESNPGETAEDLANEIRRRVTTGSDIALRHVKIVPRNWLLKTSSGKVARGANRDQYLKKFG